MASLSSSLSSSFTPGRCLRTTGCRVLLDSVVHRPLAPSQRRSLLTSQTGSLFLYKIIPRCPRPHQRQAFSLFVSGCSHSSRRRRVQSSLISTVLRQEGPVPF